MSLFSGETVDKPTLVAKKGIIPPSVSDIPDGTFIVWHDTVGNTVKLFYNKNGTLVSATLS
jgi:hypothetical protein